MDRVVHFEIPVSDGEKAKQFYEAVFGWEIEKWPPVDYWLVTTGPETEPGINGGLTPKSKEGEFEEPLDIVDAAHAVNTVITIQVESIDESMEKVKKAGGKITMDKWLIRGIGWVCYFSDLDGNILGLMESDEGAK